MEALLPGDVGIGVAAGLVALSFATSWLTAAFGIGGGTVMLAALASLISPAALVPVHGLVQLGSNAGRAAVLFTHADRAVLVPFVLGALAGVAAGGAVVVELPPAAIRLAVGLFVLWSLAARPPAFMRRSALVAGAASSFLTMFFGATGPFVAAYVKTLGLGRLTHVGTHASMMTIQHGLKTLAFGFLGFAFGEWLGLILAMIATGFLGTLAGRHTLMRIDERRFRLGLNLLLALLALRLIWTGGAALLAGQGA